VQFESCNFFILLYQGSTEFASKLNSAKKGFPASIAETTAKLLPTTVAGICLKPGMAEGVIDWSHRLAMIMPNQMALGPFDWNVGSSQACSSKAIK